MKKLLLFILLVSNVTFAGNERFNNVLVSYERLHKAFFDNDIKKIQKSANNVLSGIKIIKNERISKTLNYTEKKLIEIIESSNIEESKEKLNIISQGLFVVLKKYAVNKNYVRYYCPMVKKYWIQNILKSKKIMNPYASVSMPHCGMKK
jgi:predicted RNA-binding Zn-ribbon protein involved in translation (DUF1610 family)